MRLLKNFKATLFAVFAAVALIGWSFAAQDTVAEPTVKLEQIQAKSVNIGQTLRFRAVAKASGAVVFSLSGEPPGASINATDGTFVWTPREKGNYAFEVVVALASSPEDKATTAVNVRVLDADAPVVTPIDSATVAVGTTVRLTVKATKRQETGGKLVYSLTTVQEGATIDAYTGRFEWTPKRGGVYRFEVAVAPEGAPWQVSTESFTVSVMGAQPPVFEPTRAYQMAVGGQFVHTFTARDINVPAQPLIYSLSNEPQGMTIDPASGRVIWRPLEAGVAKFSVTATVTNRSDLTTTIPVQVNVHGMFGYNFFESARALVDGRMEAIRSGKFVPGVPELVRPGGAKALDRSGDKEADKEMKATDEQIATIDPLRNFVGPDLMSAFNVATPDPERYQLGPGDVLTVRWWSPTQEPREEKVRVDSRGNVSIPGYTLRAVVRGQTIGQAERLLRLELAKQIRGAEVLLQLSEVRTMSISVMGEAYLPGRYQVPSVATLFNAIYTVGGPSQSGSLRRIELRRSDGTKHVLDMYQFLLTGDAKQDLPLQPGDAIYIPPVQRKVVLTGEAFRPAVFEIIPGERLQDVIKYAGGLRPTAVSGALVLDTVDPGKGRRLVSVNLDNDNPALADGDIVDVPAVRSEVANAATVEGPVDRPGRFPVFAGMKVSDLLAASGGIRPEAWAERFDLFRRNDDQTVALVTVTPATASTIEVKPFDRLVVYKTTDLVWTGNRSVEARGAVRKAGTFYRADGMRLVDLLIQTGGLLPDAEIGQAFVQRTSQDGTPGELIKVDLRKAIAGDLQANLVLQDRDSLLVQTVNEASYKPTQVVQILGAVQAPGVYPRAVGMSLRDLLQLAGGPMPDAGPIIEVARSRVPEGTPIERMDLQEAWTGGQASGFALADGDLVTIASSKDVLIAPKTVTILGEVSNPGPYALTGKGDRLSTVMERAGGLTEAAFPEGTQFLRNPRKLRTDVQQSVAPKIKTMLELVTDAEYRRALARSEIEKLRVAAATTGPVNIAGLSGGSSQQKPPTIPEIKGQTVTPARELSLSELTPAGNVNIDLVKALALKSGTSDIVLEDGDIIVVPPKPTTVSVAGAVTVPSSTMYVPGKNVEHYVKLSGGFTLDAAMDRILVIKANGQVVQANRRTKVDLGDVVFVPTTVMSAKLSDKQSEIDAISRNVTGAAVVLAILRSIIP